MDQVFLLFLVGTTSAVALLIGRRALGLSRARLWTGTQRALELVGAAVAFFLVNLIVGVLVILAMRTFTNHFISIYYLKDVVLVVLSAVQGLVFHCWRRS